MKGRLLALLIIVGSVCMASGCQSAELIQLVNDYSDRVEASQYKSDQFEAKFSVNGVYPTIVIKQKDYDHYVVWLTLYSESSEKSIQISDLWIGSDVRFESSMDDVSEALMAKSGLYESVSALTLLDVDSVKNTLDKTFDVAFTLTVDGEVQRIKFSVNKVIKKFSVTPT
jgi:hypothetical protein